ncbi:hypothetical protein T4D_3133 [Trichinella pseudospiralis]|nr:hypothetical protein T4D_3133 [Trichinella pseudospiralis]
MFEFAVLIVASSFFDLSKLTFFCFNDAEMVSPLSNCTSLTSCQMCIKARLVIDWFDGSQHFSNLLLLHG